MSFTKQKAKTLYLYDSHIENIFINEYLPAAPGDFVKIYVYGLMYAQMGLPMTNDVIAEQLQLPEKTVNEAWTYWEQLHLVRRSYASDAGLEPAIEFLSLKEEMYAPKMQEQDREEEPELDLSGEEKKKLFEYIERAFRRALSSTEVGEVLNWTDEERIEPDVIRGAVDAAAENGKDSIRYVSRIVHSWVREGLHTKEDVEKFREETDRRHGEYRMIMRELGFTRNPTEKEKQMMDSWLDDMGYSMERIREACGRTAGISNPNFNYINKVLLNWKEEADRRGDSVNDAHPVTNAVLNRYYQYLREKAEREAQERRREVYEKIPRIREIDEETRKTGFSVTRMILQGSREEAEAARKRMNELAEERAFLLTEHNLEMDYTDIHYLCPKCKDTGITDDGAQCTCIEERRREARDWMRTNGRQDGRKSDG